MFDVKSLMLFGAIACAVGGCSATISQSSFFPSTGLTAPNAVLQVPPGYIATDQMLVLGKIGSVRAVRLDNPSRDAVIIYSAGNGGFVDSESTSRIVESLARVTGSDIILYDYPGRGGTTMPATIDAATEFGPLMMGELRNNGWVGRGPVYAYGLSFGGSMAASLARSGGLSGLIIEGSAADYQAIGRDFVPKLAKPFVRLRVDAELRRFDYLGYAIAGGAPVLLLSGIQDKVIRPARMREFADQLTAGGTKVTFQSVPAGHGGALATLQGEAALRTFIAKHSVP